MSKFVQGLTALSGFLYASKEIKSVKKFYGNNILKLLMPAVFCMILIFGFDLFFGLITWNFDPTRLLLGTRAYTGVTRYHFQFGNFYYLGYILICYLITPLLMKNKVTRAIIIPLAIIAEMTFVFFTGFVICITPYIIGYVVGRIAFENYVDKKKEYPFIGLIFWIFILLTGLFSYIILIGSKFGGGYFATRSLEFLRNLSASTFGTAFFFVFILIFRFINFDKKIKFFEFTDKWTYMLYLLNQVFMLGATSIVVVTDKLWLKFVLVYVCTFALSIGLQFLYGFISKKRRALKERKQTPKEA